VQYARLPALPLASRVFHAEVLWLMRNTCIGPLYPIFRSHLQLYVPWNPKTSSLTVRIENSSSFIEDIIDCYFALSSEIHACCRSLIVGYSSEEMDSLVVSQLFGGLLTDLMRQLYAPVLDTVRVKGLIRIAF
jgi:hypothetical protein